jgi:putative ABC transport system substrate-binding protein
VAEAASRERGWKLLSLEVRDAAEIETMIKRAADARAGAILVLAGGLLFPQSRSIAELATRNRLPTMFGLRQSVEAGGLSSYGADISEIWRRGAFFVDKILKGAKAADLPVEQPTKFEFVINMKTAKALGLKIPQSVLARADQVIQ